MPLYDPPESIAAGGLTVDMDGFLTIPNDTDAVAFKFDKEAVSGGPPDTRYRIIVKHGTEKIIYSAEP